MLKRTETFAQIKILSVKYLRVPSFFCNFTPRKHKQHEKEHFLYTIDNGDCSVFLQLHS